MKREFELKLIELEVEAELEHLMLKTKLEHEVKKIERKFQEDNSAKLQSTLHNVRFFSFHESRERLDDCLDQLPHGETEVKQSFLSSPMEIR